MNLLNYNTNKTVMEFNTAKKVSNATDVELSNFLRDIGENQDKSAFSSIFKYFAPRLKSFFVKLGCSRHKPKK